MLTRSNNLTGARRLFCAAVWLAVAFVAVKASYLGMPDRSTVDSVQDFVRSIDAISYRDVLFAAALWAAARVVLALAGNHGALTHLVSLSFVALAASLSAYSLANVILFGVFGGSLTYPMLLM